MKVTSNLLLITAITVLLIAPGCFKKPDEPKIDIDSTIPIGEVYTLKNLIDSIAIVEPLPYTFGDDASIYATVTMDEKNGNLFKQLYVQDATHAIRLVFSETTGFSTGDSIRVYLKGKTFFDNNGTYEIQTLQPDSCVIALATRRFITPEEVTIEELKGNSRLVKITDVEFSDFDLGETWADTTRTVSAVNHTLKNCNDNTILVRTSSYASFAGRTLPGGKGSMVAIAGVYRTDIQLWNRSLSETKMDDYRCDGSSGEDIKILLKESFAFGQGDFTIHDVSGDQTWVWSSQYSCMLMSGRLNNTNYENEDWLISPAVDMRYVVSADLSFDHAGRFVTPFSNYFTLWVSSDYNGNNFEASTWKQFTIPKYMTGVDFTFFNSGRINLT
ncbi:MAG: DUF5689 domain-containing protein, partial [Dysgonamonadaceae bacterium]|nr:DUF5689 domain-containing protein [Dysgonamonadaceae bacterium]